MSDQSPRSREVFISYSSKNKKWADAACAVLERHRIRCWIAPRDILAGEEWGTAIIGGIEACRIMVVIFSADANASSHVRREVERAISKGLTVLPFRIEDVSPAGAMEFALSSTHWLDGFEPPPERQLEALARSVKTLLDRGEPGPSSASPLHASRRPTRRLLVVTGIAVVAVGAGAVGYRLNRGVAGPPDDPIIEGPQPKPPPADGDLQVGASVRVTVNTSVFADEETDRTAPPHTVEVGRKGEVIKVPRNGSRCLVRFDTPPHRDVWIIRTTLEIE